MVVRLAVMFDAVVTTMQEVTLTDLILFEIGGFAMVTSLSDARQLFAELLDEREKPLNLADFKNPRSGGFQAMFHDVSIRFIKLSTPESRIRAMLSIAWRRGISARTPLMPGAEEYGRNRPLGDGSAGKAAAPTLYFSIDYTATSAVFVVIRLDL